MRSLEVWWAVFAALIVLGAGGAGYFATGRWTGLLIDSRGRYSLTHLQVTCWTTLVLSLAGGFVVARIGEHRADALSVVIPSHVLQLLGISLASAVLATAAKSAKDRTSSTHVAATPVGPDGDPGSPPPPRFEQVFLLEEGTYADHAVDVAKFQNLVITLILLVLYVGAALDAIGSATSAEALRRLPDLSGSFVTLLGLSHGGYLLGKLPTQEGEPAHSVAQRTPPAARPRRRRRRPVVPAALSADPAAPPEEAVESPQVPAAVPTQSTKPATRKPVTTSRATKPRTTSAGTGGVDHAG